MATELGGGVQPDSGLGVGLSPREAAALLLDKIRQGNGYARGKKKRFGRSAAVTKVATLVLSAASTVILGLQNLNAWAGPALACVALVTLLGAVEPFFNWRSRWVLMEEAQYRFQRLADHLEYLVASTAADELTFDQLNEIFGQHQAIWGDLGRTWLEHRREPAPSTSA
ncbi:SLATT domain-containing protein [Streptomyces sp. NPDC006872]|uniref:SLATT domain-containing protein n=1 Tax=Streptomyces sp. NPDC006872 TaxID=3155720 RepID=UPI0033F0BA26